MGAPASFREYENPTLIALCVAKHMSNVMLMFFPQKNVIHEAERRVVNLTPFMTGTQFATGKLVSWHGKSVLF